MQKVYTFIHKIEVLKMKQIIASRVFRVLFEKIVPMQNRAGSAVELIRRRRLVGKWRETPHLTLQNTDPIMEKFSQTPEKSYLYDPAEILLLGPETPDSFIKHLKKKLKK